MSSTIILDASEHPLTSVTIFKSHKAEIVRSFKLSFQKGQNKVEIRNLSGSIDSESARIIGLRSDLQLFDVVCTNSSPASKPLFGAGSVSVPEPIRLLEAKKAALTAEKKAITSATFVLENYSKTLKSDDVTPEQADNFLDTYVRRARKLVKEGAEIEEQILEVEKAITKEREERDKKKGSTAGMVSVVVMAKREMEAEFKLTYIVHGASWAPSYELHAATESGKPSSSVSLHYRATIKQGTGEDWNGVALTLSTASMDQADQQVPSIQALRIRPPTSGSGQPVYQQQAMQQQHMQQQQRAPPQFSLAMRERDREGTANGPPTASGIFGGGRGGFGGGRGGFGGGALFGSIPGPGGLAPQAAPPAATTATQNEEGWTMPESFSSAHEEAEETLSDSDSESTQAMTPGTLINESPLSISYTVEGQSSIPTDGVAHKVSVAELKFETKVMHIAVPRVRAQAYLQAQVKNTSDYRLLPGPVTILMNDSYVSKTSIQDIAPGDSFDCTFGPDTSTRISYTRNIKRTTAAASAFTEQYTTTTFVSVIKVHNRHAFAIDKIILRDALAVSDDEKKVKVLLKRPTSLLSMAELEGAEDSDDAIKGAESKGKGAEGRENCVAKWQEAKDGKGGKKDGLFEWICEDIEAGKEISVETEWDVRAPADVKWVEVSGHGRA